MEDKPSTSMGVEEQSSLIRNGSKKKSGGLGGTSCCVPLCASNSKRNPELSFHKFPKDPKLRKAWLHWISRADFKPNDYHRVCSKHFKGGKKTYVVNIPTIVPKHIKPTPSKARPTSKCMKRESDLVITKKRKRASGSTAMKDMKKEISELKDAITNLKKEKQQQGDEILVLREKVEQQAFSVQRFKNSTSHFELYTGFPNYQTFKAFYDFLCPTCKRLRYHGSDNSQVHRKEKSGPQRALSPEEELFLCLSRLKCGLLEKDLAIRYNISVSQVSRIWVTWLDFLRNRLRSIPIWPSRDFVKKTMPPSFEQNYPNTRVIIDCTELFLEMPSDPRSQSATFSTYKHHNTGKGLIGISPRGDVVFVSELYAGNTSDRQLAKDCGILNLLEPGDEIMADRGFSIEDDLPAGVTLNIPPFLKDGEQFSEADEVGTRRIAKHRIHVERAIQRIKSFRLLQHTFPLSMAADLNKIWIVCSYLTLFRKPLLSQHEE